MKIKRFHARTMRDALQQVREEQGPDSVILSKQRVGDGIEVIAAVDYDEALLHQSNQVIGARVSGGSRSAADTRQPAATAAAAPADREQVSRRYGRIGSAGRPAIHRQLLRTGVFRSG